MGSKFLQDTDLVLVHAMLLGQTVFLATWSTLPWWKEWVGRSLWIKSAALWLFLLVAIVNYWVIEARGPYPGMDWVVLVSHILVLAGIWSQVVALAHEIRKADSEDRRVSGTDKTRK